MGKEITVVTAFFNINRSNWKGFARSEDKYFEYFSSWAKIKNKLVVYVENEYMEKKILDFRSELGLKDKTVVYRVEDYKKIDQELYASIKNATENKVQKLYRLQPANPEVWNNDYNYVMLLKMWCVQDAVSKGVATGMIAWMDFGYNHGGEAISLDSDFNFLWTYDFPQKINLFYIQKPDNRPIFDIVFLMDTYIMGTVIIGQDKLWRDFWLLMKKNMMSLNACGMTDDDQNIILMCYRERPEMFELHESKWQLPMWQFGGRHLKIVEPTKKVNSVKRYGRNIKKWWADCRYVYAIYKRIRHFSAH